MIWKEQLVTPSSRSEVLGFFEKLMTIRDQCAHPRMNTALLAKENLAQFISSAKRMRLSLREYMQTQGIPLVRTVSL